ncbi:hypothetical protein PAL_GLEAN10008264 [Pteropus alecto]|uniref:Uncharacterized protein n=1 Tax=Pteropus alecto TaxID=9402 RepID=L5KE47_PTEAL|nr:hypothetical protein PAL_GLEAN10008264 [Pteropus alecto]
MLSPIFILWNVGYFLYNYGTIFIIILIIWQAKRSYDGLRLEPKTSCCRRHRRVKQWARNATTKDSSLKNKMKTFLPCINVKTKGKVHKESMFLTAEKVANTRKENVEKRLATAKSPTGQTKAEKTRDDPKAQSPPTEKQVGLAVSDGPHSPGSKLRHRSISHQFHSASVLDHHRHCLRHCPRVACATHPGNPP